MKTKDPIYQGCVDLNAKQGNASLGLSSSISWNDDPKRMAFLFSRYKFVAKMLEGQDKVLEIGCGDAFASRVVMQHVNKLIATDYDPVFIQSANEIMSDPWAFECFVHDILISPVGKGTFDAAYSLDVLEHMPVEKEYNYFSNISSSLSRNGIFILGMPSLNSQKFASPRSKAGHINCKSSIDLKKLCGRFFNNTFSFSMNDEVVHTGFHEMANYLFVVCCGPKMGPNRDTL